MRSLPTRSVRPPWPTLFTAALLLLLALLAGCGTGRTTIFTAPEARRTATTVTLREGASTVAVPEEVRRQLTQRLEKGLYQQAGFQPGPEVVLRWRFVQFNTGDRFQRWFWGGVGNSGEASMTVEAVFLDAEGRELARIMAEGRIGSGFFSGSADDALTKVAEEIVRYAQSTFR